MADITWVYFQGEEGTILRGYLADATGRLNLDDFASVLVTARYKNEDPVIDLATCTPDPNQDEENAEDGKGWFSYTVTADDAAIPAKSYKLQFVGMDGATPRYFPKKINGNETFGMLIVRRPLA